MDYVLHHSNYCISENFVTCTTKTAILNVKKEFSSYIVLANDYSLFHLNYIHYDIITLRQYVIVYMF